MSSILEKHLSRHLKYVPDVKHCENNKEVNPLHEDKLTSKTNTQPCTFQLILLKQFTLIIRTRSTCPITSVPRCLWRILDIIILISAFDFDAALSSRAQLFTYCLKWLHYLSMCASEDSLAWGPVQFCYQVLTLNKFCLWYPGTTWVIVLCVITLLIVPVPPTCRGCY